MVSRRVPVHRPAGLAIVAVVAALGAAGCGGKSATQASGEALAASVPVAISIPKIKANSSLIQLGLDRTGQIASPPLTDAGQAGWYAGSPTPGQDGPATIVGHVDSAKSGPGVFYRLRDLTKGDVVDVKRKDGVTARFKIEKVKQVRKTAFPTNEVYRKLDHAGLRLITCGGTFNRATRHYEDNVIAFARMVSHHK